MPARTRRAFKKRLNPSIGPTRALMRRRPDVGFVHAPTVGWFHSPAQTSFHFRGVRAPGVGGIQEDAGAQPRI